MRCCRGARDPHHEAILAKLRHLGIDLPDGARILGPSWAWRVVDVRGQEPRPAVWSKVLLAEAAMSTLYAEATPDGFEIHKAPVFG